jgi:hypothetical protein
VVLLKPEPVATSSPDPIPDCGQRTKCGTIYAASPKIVHVITNTATHKESLISLANAFVPHGAVEIKFKSKVSKGWNQPENCLPYTPLIKRLAAAIKAGGFPNRSVRPESRTSAEDLRIRTEQLLWHLPVHLLES